MTKEEIARRANDENVKFIKNNICNCKGDKDYVFISYKSDDWETVLHDIVYKLVKDHGLNVYFDGDFDSHNSLWIDQFRENMISQRCKGVIAFFDNKYATSYATLMELMYSQTQKAALGKNTDGLPIVPIDLEEAKEITSEEDTGLGVDRYEDKTVNVNASREKELFSNLFNELKELDVLDKKTQFIWEPGDSLNAKTCSSIVLDIKARKGINNNYYNPDMSLDEIAEKIRDACGPTVFNKVLTDEEEHKVTIQSKPEEIHRSDSIEKRDDKTNNSLDTVEPKENSLDDKCESITKDSNPNGTTKETVNIVSDGSIYRIKGRNDSYDAFYCTDGATYTVLKGSRVKYNEKWTPKKVWDKYKGRITKDGYLLCDIEGLKISTAACLIEGTSTNGKELNDEKKLLENGKRCTVTFGSVCNLDAEIEQRNKTIDVYSEDRPAFELEGNEQNEKKDWTGKQLQNDENSAFEFELWGVLHSSGSMAGMMHDVFDLIAEKYPNRISDMADDDSITSVARKDDVDSGKLPPSKMNYFNTKKEHSVNGTLYYVSTRYNREQGIGQLKKMLTLCEGSSEEFRITSAPKKSTHNVNKSVKKTLVEAINE